MKLSAILMLLCLSYSAVSVTQGQSMNGFGYSVAGAGDINNDGYADLLIGEPQYLNLSRQGRASLILGGPDSINSLNRWVIMYGSAAWDELGFSVAGAGDLNGDGVDDFIVAAELAGPNLPRNSSENWDGRVYVYYGRQGFDGTGHDVIPDVTLKGDFGGERFGWEVAGIGDVNDDGFDDVLVSNANYFYGYGRAYVFFGGSPMDSLADILLAGDVPNDGFGWHISKAGDVNYDGVSDFIVTIRNDGGNGTDAGKANVYFGGAALDSIPDLVLAGPAANSFFGSSSGGVGDVNGDTFDDFVIAASKVSRAFLYFGGPAVDSIPDLIVGRDFQFGKSVAGIGDVNSDGFADFVVTGSPENNYRGGGFVYYGGSPMDSLIDVTYGGLTSTDVLGWDVAGVGDFNGDGKPDWVMGAPYLSDFGVGADRALIIFSGNPDTLIWIDYQGPIDVNEAKVFPNGYSLGQNYPNPFNPTTKIKYNIPELSFVTLKVYDILGNKIESLINEEKSAGTHELIWNAINLSSGVYFYQLKAGNYVDTKKMILLK